MSDDFLPYSRQSIEEEDVKAVVDALTAPIISQGSRLEAFEAAFEAKTGADHAVGVSSGSAALHAMCFCAGLGPGDEVILPALTFASTANAVLHVGAKPVFVDVSPATLCIDPDAVEAAWSPKTRAVLAVDFAGHPAPYRELRSLAGERGALVLADSAHSVGGSYGGAPIGSIADVTAFSFNPVKNMTTAEGGMLTTDDPDIALKARMFRVHGMTRDPDTLESEPPGGWYYEQQFLGFNYKLSELHAALGLTQLGRVDEFNRRRTEIAVAYADLLAGVPLHLPPVPENGVHTWHLFVTRTHDPAHRGILFRHLRDHGVGAQVHYIPVPMHPHFQRLGYSMDRLPHAVDYYSRAVSIPMHPAMSDSDVDRVVELIQQVL